MDKEKDLLKQGLSKLETVEEVEKLREDAELLGHEDVVEDANKKILEIQSKSNNVEKTSEAQVVQVESMGGSKEELNNRTGEVDKKIEEVKTEAIKEVEVVKNEINTADTNEIFIFKDPIQNELVGRLKSENDDIISYEQNKITALKKIKESPELNSLNEKAKKLKELKEAMKGKTGDSGEYLLNNYRKEERSLEDLVRKVTNFDGGFDVSSSNMVLNPDEMITNTEERIKNLSNPEIFNKKVEAKFAQFQTLKEFVIQKFGAETKQSFDKYELYLSSGVSNINDYIKQKLEIKGETTEEFQKERNDLIKTGAFYHKFLVGTNWSEEAIKKFPDFKTYKPGDYLSN